MKQSIIVIFFFLLLTKTAHTQDLETHKNLSLKVMPLSMIDHFPRMRLGLEYYSDKDFAYSLDIGIGNNTLNKGRLNGLIWGQDYSFYEIRPEIKYLFVNKKYFYTYCGLELFYMNMKDFLESREYYKENSDIVTTYDSAKFNKQKYGAHFIGGINLIAAKRICFDFYGGLGLARRTISYSNVVNPAEDPNYYEDDLFPYTYKHEGKAIVFQLALGFKIGYKFWIKK